MKREEYEFDERIRVCLAVLASGEVIGTIARDSNRVWHVEAVKVVEGTAFGTYTYHVGGGSFADLESAKKAFVSTQDTADGVRERIEASHKATMAAWEAHERAPWYRRIFG
jgi:hypothetical protein